MSLRTSLEYVTRVSSTHVTNEMNSYNVTVYGQKAPVWSAYGICPALHFRCFEGGFRKPAVEKTVAKLKEIDDIMLATGLYKRIAILPGGTNMTPKVERSGLDVLYRRIQ